MRTWVSPRSLLLHALFLVIAGGCLTAFWWQVHRAMQGNTLSYLYSVEWPAFAIVAGIGWWQLIHDTPEDIAARRAYHERMRRASAEVVARTLPRSARALTVGSEEVNGPALATSQRPALEDGRSSPGADLVRAGDGPSATSEAAAARDLEAVLLGADADEGPADELTEYNRYLALLAIKGKPKTWRNPRGM